ncbi:MAG: DUF2811 domain-containing protein [Cyanobacteria bacterium P01_D01_bin.36]
MTNPRTPDAQLALAAHVRLLNLQTLPKIEMDNLSLVRTQYPAKDTAIAVEVQIPERLNKAIGDYLDAHPTASFDSLAANAIAFYLISQGVTDRDVCRYYLDDVMGGAA